VVEEEVDQDQERVVLDPGKFEDLVDHRGVEDVLLPGHVNDKMDIYEIVIHAVRETSALDKAFKAVDSCLISVTTKVALREEGIETLIS
jgi:hypothetical protein